MITSYYNASGSEEDLNGKRIKHDHPKNTTAIFIGENDPPLSVTLPIELLFNVVSFQSIPLVRVVRKNITWVI